MNAELAGLVCGMEKAAAASEGGIKGMLGDIRNRISSAGSQEEANKHFKRYQQLHRKAVNWNWGRMPKPSEWMSSDKHKTLHDKARDFQRRLDEHSRGTSRTHSTSSYWRDRYGSRGRNIGAAAGVAGLAGAGMIVRHAIKKRREKREQQQ
jgi:hypothetical protein